MTMTVNVNGNGAGAGTASGTRAEQWAKQRQAEDVWIESAGTMSSADLAARFNMGERWARKRIEAAKKRAGAAGNGAGGTDPAGTVTAPERRDIAPDRREPRQGPGTGSGTGSGTVRRAPAARPRRRNVPPLVVAGAIAATAVVTVVGAVISYSHIRDLAVAAGQGWRADILPLSLDGLVAASTFCLVVDRGRGRRWGHPVAWAGIAIGIVGSVAANVLAVVPGLVDLQVIAAVMAAFPPIALAMCAELLVHTVADR